MIEGEGYSYVGGVAPPAHTVKQIVSSGCNKSKEAGKLEEESTVSLVKIINIAPLILHVEYHAAMLTTRSNTVDFS